MMSNISYDLDTSGGLMPQIQELIRPPDQEPESQKPKKQHPYYKRPGKGHNRDSCDACNEGGDLICCDRCPASFHLGCHDPPLEESDIPQGQWLCRECRAADAERASSTRSSRAHTPADSEKSSRSIRSNRSTSTHSKKSDKDSKCKKNDDKAKDDNQESMPEEKDLSPMEILVKAAKIMNPRQFELPREMKIPCPFPGTEKEVCKNGNGGVSVVSADAWGCVPLPVRTCFACGNTCKHAPLLHCDYCPLLFHQDCLDPPLTALPTGRWMCPNHVEQYIDWKMVNSVSATERVALWDKYTGPIDQHAIKLDFIRRAKKYRPCFRIKIPVEAKGRVCVPDMVKYHYENPPPLLPSRREYLRCKNVLKQRNIPFTEADLLDTTGPKHKICLNLSCASCATERDESEREREREDGEPCPRGELRGLRASEAQRDLQLIRAADGDAVKRRSDDELSSGSEDELGLKRRKMSQSEAEEERGSRRKEEEFVALKMREGEGEEILEAAELQLRRLDHRLVKILAWQRLQQILTGERCFGPWRRVPLSEQSEKLVVDSIDRTKLTKYGFRHVAMPSEMLSRADHERIAAAVWGPPDGGAPPSPPPSPRSHLSIVAALTPVQRHNQYSLGDGLGRPVAMRLSRLTVGWGSDCDVVLAHYGTCRYTSRLHALIFMDEISRHFELINYSEYGTRVNGALYSCELGARGADCDETAAAFRAIADRRRRHAPLRVNGDLTSSEGFSEECRCPSPSARPLVSGYEGSAILLHGTLLQFGCQMFVFSITDTPVPASQD